MFDGFNLSMLEGLPNKNLEYRLNLKFEVKQIRVFIIDLNRLIIAIGVWHENWGGLKPLKI